MKEMTLTPQELLEVEEFCSRQKTIIDYGNWFENCDKIFIEEALTNFKIALVVGFLQTKIERQKNVEEI